MLLSTAWSCPVLHSEYPLGNIQYINKVLPTITHTPFPQTDRQNCLNRRGPNLGFPRQSEPKSYRARCKEGQRRIADFWLSWDVPGAAEFIDSITKFWKLIFQLSNDSRFCSQLSNWGVDIWRGSRHWLLHPIVLVAPGAWENAGRRPCHLAIPNPVSYLQNQTPISYQLCDCFRYELLKWSLCWQLVIYHPMLISIYEVLRRIVLIRLATQCLSESGRRIRNLLDAW